jgi:hypothetical protein
MASIAPDARGYQRVFFLDKDGKRRCVCLGKLPPKRVDAIAVRIAELNAANIAGVSVDNDTAQWLSQIGTDLYRKLTAVELVKPRGQSRLGDFLQTYIDARKDIKARTRLNLDVCKARLVEFFGAEKDLRGINPGDADAWVVFLKGKYARQPSAGPSSEPGNSSATPSARSSWPRILLLT